MASRKLRWILLALFPLGVSCNLLVPVVFIGEPGNTAILQSRLKDAAVDAFVKDESLVPFSFAGAIGRGVFQVVVPTADLEKAQPVIEEFLEEEARDVGPEQ